MSLISLIIFNLAFAALPPKTAQISALELLSMPEGNRYQISEGQEGHFYPGLIAIARDEKQSLNLRWKVLTLAAKVKSTHSAKDIKDFLTSKDWFMRNAALLSLNSISSEEGRAAAKTLLQDKALVIRSAAAEVLSQHLDRASRDLFWEAMDNAKNFRGEQSLWIRPQMLKALAKNPEKNELPLFLKNLEDRDHQVQASAIEALENLTQKKFESRNLADRKKMWQRWAKTSEAQNL